MNEQCYDVTVTARVKLTCSRGERVTERLKVSVLDEQESQLANEYQ